MATHVIGDTHGCLDQLLRLLTRLGLLDDRLFWSGGASGLWFLGDYTDRGPDGVGVIELVMRLQREAPEAGGMVGALLGNHDLLVLNAFRFPFTPVPGFLHSGQSLTFRELWLDRAGGQERDAECLSGAHLEWLAGLPVLALLGQTLLMHADSTFYLDYGRSVETVNARFRTLLEGGDVAARDRLEEAFARRREFLPGWQGEDAALQNLHRVLATYGADRLVHGHTPVYTLLERPASEITEAWVYQHGRCVNVDHALYAGGEGFAFVVEE